MWILILEMLIEDFISELTMGFVKGISFILLFGIAALVFLVFFSLAMRVVIFAKKDIDPIQAITPQRKNTAKEYIEDSFEADQDYQNVTNL